MNQARIDTEEWLYVWQETSELDMRVKKLEASDIKNNTEHKNIDEWFKRLEYRIQVLEEKIG